MIVAIGDSITAGQFLHPSSAWPYHVGVPILARGVPGDTTRLALERFPADVQATGASTVIIQFGHNDANRWQTDRGLPRVSIDAYAANLVEMIRRCRAFDAEPYLCTLTPCWRSGQHAKDVAVYDEMLRDVASVEEVGLIDVRAAFGDGQGLVMDDGLHLTLEGHQVYAATVRDALQLRVAA